MAADGTLLTGVEGGNELDGHARQFGLVGQLPLQILERPGIQVSALLSTSLNPRANVLEVFKSNPSLRAFSIGDNLFTDTVVYITTKQGLFPAAFFHGAWLLIKLSYRQPTQFATP